MKKFVLSLVLFLLPSLATMAQNVNIINDLGINVEDLEAVRERIILKVDEFQSAVSDLAGRSKMTHSDKMVLRSATLKNFIGEGEMYEIQVPYFNGFRDSLASPVTMGVISSKYKGRRYRTPMKDYLADLIRKSENPNHRYKRIVIEAADAVRVDNLTKVGDGRFTATAHILQHYMGFNGEGRRVYHDYTAKTITIFINQKELIAPNGEKVLAWEILLGDIDCDSIW